MSHIFFESSLEGELKSALDHYQGVLLKAGIIAATPALLEDVAVQYQGFPMKILQLATVRVTDKRSLLVEPWDKSALKAIEEAIRRADLGVLIAPEEAAVRVTLPPVTAEDKERIIKHLGGEKEKARIGIRTIRDKVWKEIQTKETAAEISEDQKFSFKEKLEKMVTEANTKVEEITAKRIDFIRQNWSYDC